MRFIGLVFLGLLTACSPVRTPDVTHSDTKVEESAEVQAWRNYTQTIEEAGVDILNRYPQPGPIDRAEGLTYLAQQLGASIDQTLLKQPNQIPLLRVGATNINKWGLDGADVKYQNAYLSPNGQYIFHGQLGSAEIFALQLVRHGDNFAAFGSLTADDLSTDDQGRFQVMISRIKPESWAGSWLEFDPEANALLVREYFRDWDKERPGTYWVERLDPYTKSPYVTTDETAALLEQSAKTFATRAPQWQSRMERTRRHLVNKVHFRKADEQGLAANYYGTSWFKLESGQGLLIEMDAPTAQMWSVQLGNVWWESLDYINNTASYNDAQVVPDTDGKYRFVLSLEDPGVVNWLDPVGHKEGQLLFRVQNATSFEDPGLTVIDLANVPDIMARTSAEQRAETIAQRRQQAVRRWTP